MPVFIDRRMHDGLYAISAFGTRDDTAIMQRHPGFTNRSEITEPFGNDIGGPPAKHRQTPPVESARRFDHGCNIGAAFDQLCGDHINQRPCTRNDNAFAGHDCHRFGHDLG